MHRRHLRLLVAASVVAIQTSGAQANDATFWRRAPGSLTRVALSVSGGISLGSYQSGLNWGLVEFLRLVHDDSAFRSHQELPNVELAAMSGASAGNINALLSGIHWCTAPGLSRPEASPYWKTWVDVGWRQLMPNGARVEAEQFGLADRSFFDSVLFPRVDTILQQSPSRPRCAVPVGITLTKQLATALPLNQYIKPVVQRHVATYAVNGRLDGRGFAVTQANARIRNDSSLGVQIAVAAGAKAELGIGDLASLVEGSMAIPYVFAPVQIKHYAATQLADAGRCPPDPLHTDQCEAPKVARFVDGGAFDNNPLFVALRLLNLSIDQNDNKDTLKYKRRLEKLRAAARGAAEPESLGVIYINPGALRSESPAAAPIVHEAPGGIDALIQWGGDFKQAATQYELHSLIRARALRSPLLDGDIDVTTRGLPLVGELFSHFGAFLGRPFREYDFYVGVYDAMHFAATASLCARQTPPVDESCVREKFATLMRTLTLGCPASHVIASMYDWDHGLNRGRSIADDAGAVSGPCADSTEQQHRWLIEKIVTAQQATVRDTTCHKGDNIRQMLCAGGFSTLLGSLYKGEVKDSIVRWSNRPGCRKHDPVFKAANCLVDHEFRKLLKNPAGTATRIALQLLERTPAIEEAARDATLPENVHQGVMEALYIVGHSALEPSRRGIDWDPSTIPDGASWARGVAHLVPYSVGVRGDRHGFEAMYRPTFYWRDFELVAPVRAVRYARMHVDTTKALSDRSRIRSFATAGLGVGWRVNWWIFNDVYVAGSRVLRPGISLTNKWANYPEVTTDLLLTHVRFSVFRLPNLIQGTGWRRYGLTVGLNDVNGILYWVKR